MKTKAVSMTESTLLKGAQAVLPVFLASSVLFLASLQLYEGSFVISPAVFIVAAMLVAYLTGVIWLSRDNLAQGHISGVLTRLNDSRWRWLTIVGLLSVLAVAVISYAGFLTTTRMIADKHDVHTVSVFNSRVYAWESSAAGLITPVSGNMFQLPVHAPLLLTSMPDSAFTNRYSNMVILEDGVPLPVPHALRSDIEKIGVGRYSHYFRFFTGKTLVYFSTSDNSNPLTNGRTIELRYQLILNPVFFILLLTLAGVLLSRSRLFLENIVVPERLCQGRQYRRGFYLVIFILAVLVFIYPLFHTWIHALTSYTTIAGYLPWSDASGWKFSATKLLHTGTLLDWSERRPLNPAIHAMISRLTGERLNWTLLGYALLAAAGSAYLARNLQKSFGLIAGLMGLGVLAYFANEFLPQTMSETLGFILGVTGFGLMWRSIQTRNPILFAIGLAIFTAGMTARPGPMTVLPMLLVWAALARMDGRKFSYKWASYAVLGLAIGFMPGTFFGKFYGTGANLPGSNFSYTLYGLALGGESWHKGYEVPVDAALTETERTRVVYAAALEQIKKDPIALLRGGARFLGNYLIWFHVYIDNMVTKPLILLLILSGIGVAVFRLKDPHISFLLAGSIGVVASAPLIFWAYDAYRAYIVTVGFDAGMAALGTTYFINLFRPKDLPRPESSIVPPPDISDRWLILSGSSLLLILIIGPVLAIATYQAPDITDANFCNAGEKSAVLHIGRSSPYIHVVESGTRTFVPAVSADTIAQIPDIHDFGLDRYIRELQTGEMMIWGYNLLEPDIDKGMYTASKAILPLDGAYYQTCGQKINLEESGTYWLVKIREARQVYP